MKLNPQIQKRLIFVALLFCILGLSLRLILKRRPASGAVAPVVTAEVPPSLPSENATPEAVRAPAEKEPDKEVPPATVTEAAKNQTLLSIQRFSRHLFPSEKIKGLSSRLAVNLIKAKEYRSARLILEDVLRTEPNNADLLNNLAFIAGEENNVTQSEEYLRKSLIVSESCAECRNNLGALLMNQGKLDEAKNFLMKAIQIEPKYQDAHLNLALAYEKSNDWKSAYEWYKKSEPLIGDQDLKKQIAVRIVWMNEIIQGMRRSIAKENP